MKIPCHICTTGAMHTWFFLLSWCTFEQPGDNVFRIFILAIDPYLSHIAVHLWGSNQFQPAHIMKSIKDRVV